MGQDLWIVRWEYIYGHIHGEEYAFLENAFGKSDDDSYAIDEDNLKEVRKGLSKADRKKFGLLLKAIAGAVKKENGDVSLAVG